MTYEEALEVFKRHPEVRRALEIVLEEALKSPVDELVRSSPDDPAKIVSARQRLQGAVRFADHVKRMLAPKAVL